MRKIEKAPDIVGTGDITCSCGNFTFTCYDVLETGRNRAKCPYCKSVLEIIEVDPDWRPE